MGCRPPGPCVSAVHQAGILEWVSVSSSAASSRPGDQRFILVSPAAGERCLAPCLSCFQVLHWTPQTPSEVVWRTNSTSPMTSDRNIISPYAPSICGLFSLLMNTLAGFTPCTLNNVISSPVHSIFFIAELTCFLHLPVEALFTTHICSDEFIDQFRNPVTSGRTEDSHSWKTMGSGSWFPGREGVMISRKRSAIFIRMIGTHYCFHAACILTSFFFLSLKGE